MERLVIRPFEPSDIDSIHAFTNQRVVASGTTQIPFTSFIERQKWFRTSPRFRPVVAELDGHVVGNAGLEVFDGRRSHVGAVGMGVDSAFHGRGIGRALMNALLDLADNWYGLYRVELEVFVDNPAAVHLYLRSGFEIEGTLRSYLYREGAYADAYAMARIRRDTV
jgi:L-phenylalanine/L-methionine N-acetyltransferase